VRDACYRENNANHCGSGGATIRLARDSGVTVDEDVDCQALIAGKSNRRTAAPTGFSV